MPQLEEPASTMTIDLRPLQADQLDTFKSLLGSSDFGGCFCAVWTAYGSDWESRCTDPATPNFHATAERVRSGHHAGYFVYDEKTLVGWTGSGPKNFFPLLATKLGSRLSPSIPQTWSIGCVAVKAEFRGQGLADKIVAAVLELARTNHATKVESYPVRPFHEPRIYRGTEGLYRRMGFVEDGHEMDGDHQILLMSRNI
jgi:GNAT superfamily N-acetyltransferase